MSVRIGILGYGNIGRGVESAIMKIDDMELVAIFTRRNPEDIESESGVPVVHADKAAEWEKEIDVMILCGGSATDLPEQTPEYVKLFNVIDSFDTHAKNTGAFFKCGQGWPRIRKTGNHFAGMGSGAVFFNEAVF